MSKFSLWLHRAGARMSAGLRSFMSGRYGSDRLNMAILCAGLIASIFSSLFRDLTVRMIFLVLSYALMFWAIYRALSRNTYKRYQENRKFLLIFDRLKDRNNRYFNCPKCHQTVRFPGGRAKSPSPAPNAGRSSSERPEFNHIPGTAAGSRIFVFCGKFSVLSSYAHLSFLRAHYFQKFSYFRVFAFFSSEKHSVL